jgi:peptidoglycan hydrolase CwlO-like protein
MAKSRRSPNPNLTLENLDEDIARTMNRLDDLEAYKTQAEAYMKKVGELLDDLQTRLSAAERVLKRLSAS